MQKLSSLKLAKSISNTQRTQTDTTHIQKKFRAVFIKWQISFLIWLRGWCKSHRLYERDVTRRGLWTMDRIWMGGEGWGSETRKQNQYFKNSYYEPGALPSALLKNPQLVRKWWGLNRRRDQSIVSRGYKIMQLTEQPMTKSEESWIRFEIKY